jgi:hypothetical protein
MPQNGAALWIYVDKESLFEISSPRRGKFAWNVHNGLALCDGQWKVVLDLGSAKLRNQRKQRKTDKSRWGPLWCKAYLMAVFVVSSLHFCSRNLRPLPMSSSNHYCSVRIYLNRHETNKRQKNKAADCAVE